MLFSYLIGVLSGVIIASFFIGKELYKYYIKNKIQSTQLEQLKQNKKINENENE